MTDRMALQAELINQLCQILAKQFNAEVEIIETHISTILLVDGFAFKIKKPVDFGFLDFTSLDKRRFFCEEELRLNRRLAPSYYLEVDHVTGTASEPELNGEGETIEYLVKMRRFEHDGQLDILLQQNRLNHQHIDELARIIADFHQSIEVASEKTLPGLVESVEHAVRQNFEQVSAFVNLFKPKFNAIFEALLSWSHDNIEHLKPFIKNRLEQGFVRECHGDMHTGNIAWHEDKLVIFDGIEFNPDFRWIDVMSEMAFITMDLEFNARPDLSYRLINGYLELTGDYEGLKILRFYQVYRAMVRTKVNCLRLSQLDPQDPEYQNTLDTIYQYLTLAEKFTHQSETFLMITQGVSGSGKSFASMQLLQAYHMIRIRSDVERKRLFPDKANRYLPQATETTYGHLHELAKHIIGFGYPVIIDATYLNQSYRLAAKTIAQQLKQAFYILSLTHDKSVLEKRIKQRHNNPNNPSEATVEVMHKQLQTLEALDDEEIADAIYIDNNETVVETFKDFLQKR